MGKKCQMGQLGLGDRWLDLRKKKEDMGRFWIGKLHVLVLESVLLCLEWEWKVEANTKENRLGDCGIVAIPCGTGMVPHTCSKIYLRSLGVSHSHYWMIYPTCMEGFCFCFFNQCFSFAVEIVSLLLQNFTSSQYVVLFYYELQRIGQIMLVKHL